MSDPNPNLNGYIKINPDQDRSLDSLTVQKFCTGCPFKRVRNHTRNPLSTGSTNSTDWSDMEPEYAPILKLQYYCSSPAYTQKSMLTYMQSSTIGGGYCPFFLEKWDQLESAAPDPDDPPQSN